MLQVNGYRIKFHIGQRAWIIRNNKPTPVIIVEIEDWRKKVSNDGSFLDGMVYYWVKLERPLYKGKKWPGYFVARCCNLAKYNLGVWKYTGPGHSLDYGVELFPNKQLAWKQTKSYYSLDEIDFRKN